MSLAVSVTIRRLAVVLVVLAGFPPVQAGVVDEAKLAVRLRDYARAATLLQSAADRGDAEAQYQLASLYRSGRGVPKDHGKASRWLREAAGQGHVKAQYNLGVMYENG